MWRTDSGDNRTNRAIAYAANPVTTNLCEQPATPWHSPSQPHCDRHHADRTIRAFKSRATPQSARSDGIGPIAMTRVCAASPELSRSSCAAGG